jgi:hypothetical protein
MSTSRNTRFPGVPQAASMAAAWRLPDVLRDLVWTITDDRDVHGYLHGSLPGNHDWLSGWQGQCGAVPDAAARASGVA